MGDVFEIKNGSAEDACESELGPEWDAAKLWTTVQSTGRTICVYGFSQLLEFSPDIYPVKKWRRVTDTLRRANVAVLYVPEREFFWQRYRQKKFLLWDALTPAIAGVIGRGLQAPDVVAYDFEKSVDILTGQMTSSDRNFRDYRSIALGDVLGLTAYAAQNKPWFLKSIA